MKCGAPLAARGERIVVIFVRWCGGRRRARVGSVVLVVLWVAPTLDRLWYSAALLAARISHAWVRHVPLYLGMAGTGTPSSGASSTPCFAAPPIHVRVRHRAALAAYVPRSRSPLRGTMLVGGVVKIRRSGAVVGLEWRSAGTGGSGSASAVDADAAHSMCRRHKRRFISFPSSVSGWA